MLIDLELSALASTADKEGRSMLILKEKGGDRILPVMMSTRRAVTMMMRRQIPLSLPVAATVADAYNLLLMKFDINLKRIEFTGIANGVFLCKIIAERDGEERVVDTCQAHDALVVACTSVCPITIDSELFEAQYMRKMGDNAFALNINVLTRNMLEEALEHAVATENFEVATQIRDELARREKVPNPIEDANPYS
ncbi:MAG: bifunctional nuclease family protein [Bacteroidaceae bacterium]|nr:bifunctional nuclease family protein [Bacteroidaceae bacterium]